MLSIHTLASVVLGLGAAAVLDLTAVSLDAQESRRRRLRKESAQANA